jgi:hypothetical protein
MTQDIEELTRIFQSVGAEDPEGWAGSQIDEDIPQLHRFLFIKQAWTHVVGEEDTGWIDRAIEDWRQNPDAPYSGQGRALERMLALGVDRSAIVDLTRAAQAAMLSSLCYQLSDPGIYDHAEEQVNSIGWALVTTDADFEPTSQLIDALHESVLSLDPTGREMRPRPV